MNKTKRYVRHSLGEQSGTIARNNRGQTTIFHTNVFRELTIPWSEVPLIFHTKDFREITIPWSVLDYACPRLRAVGVGMARSAAALHQAGDAAHLEGAPGLVERVTVVAHDLAGLGNVAQFLGQLQQDSLRLVLCGSVVIESLRRSWLGRT